MPSAKKLPRRILQCDDCGREDFEGDYEPPHYNRTIKLGAGASHWRFNSTPCQGTWVLAAGER